MLKKLVSTALFLGISIFATAAAADVAPRCKCEAPGTAPAGGAAAAVFAAGAAIVVIARKRDRRS